MGLRLDVPRTLACVVCAGLSLLLGCPSVAHAQTVVHDLFALSVPNPAGLTKIDDRTGAVVYSVPNGSLFATQGPDGFLYTPSRRVDPATGAAVLPWRTLGGPGLDFGPDGDLYGSSDNAVGRYVPVTGTRLFWHISLCRQHDVKTLDP